MAGIENDHDIELDEMLADAAVELRSTGMLALAQAVDIARMKLGGNDTSGARANLAVIAGQQPLPGVF